MAFDNIDKIPVVAAAIATFLAAASAAATGITTSTDELLAINMGLPSDFLKAGKINFDVTIPPMPSIPTFENPFKKINDSLISYATNFDPCHTSIPENAGILNVLMLAISAVISGVTNALSDVIDQIVSILFFVVDSIRDIWDWFYGVVESITGYLSGIYNDFSKAKDNAVSGSVEKTLWDRALKWLREKWTQFTKALGKIKQNIKDLISLLTDTRGELVIDLEELLKSASSWAGDCNCLIGDATKVI